MKGRIAEIFESVQGEGIYLGQKQLFVRSFGCNLGSCKFCDTKLKDFREYEPQDLLLELRKRSGDCTTVSFTGGEPLLQKEFLKEMLRLTHEHGFINYLETNGTLVQALEEVIDYLDIVAMDLKLPSSTGLKDFWDTHRNFLQIASRKEVFLKIVICQSTSEEDLFEAIKLIKETNRYIILVLQPNSAEDYGSLEAKIESFKEICIKEGIVACIIPQVHKEIGIK